MDEEITAQNDKVCGEVISDWMGEVGMKEESGKASRRGWDWRRGCKDRWGL